MTKNKWLGSLLNFLVPGLGNIYGRNIKKGVLNYILFFIVVFSLRFIAYNFALFLVSFTCILGYYLYLIVSGYRGVKKNNNYEPANFDKWYVYILIIALHWLLINSIKGRTLDNLTPINFARIPTPAMEPALLPDDLLAFKKTKAIERNDVTIFWFPEDVKTMYIKRCIGLPGDTLRIKNSIVLINGAPLPGIPVKFKYVVITNGPEINSRILRKNHINESDYLKLLSDTYRFFLTEEQAKALRELHFLKKVELSIATEGEPEAMIYPKSGTFNWNTDFYGAIYIPKKGDKIQLNDKNIDLYLKCIEFENESVERDSTGLKVNGQQVTTYEFKENYFFMMGDNRHNSFDSRYWGLLPQELVMGKAMYLYWGRTGDRIGKKII